MNFLKLLTLSLLLLSTKAFAQDPNFHIYLCFGQSNMEGQGTIEANDRIVDDRFQVLQSLDCSNLGKKKGEWRKAIPPLCQCWSKLSPADYFGRTMVAHLDENINVGVINVAIGGCKIELFDKDIYQDFDSTYTEAWFQDKVKAYGGNPYAHLLNLAKQAQQAGVIKGILLHQGESNTGDAQWPKKVAKIYTDLITDLELIADSIPLLAGEVVHAEQGGICASMNAIIGKLPQTLPNSYVISSKGCEDQADNLHFNSKGYRELGIRYAIQMLSIMGIEYTEPDTSTLGVYDYERKNDFFLDQNYPNPVSGKANISFQIPKKTYVSLIVTDLKGVEIAELAGSEFAKGKHAVEFDSNNLAGGIYFYTLKADNLVASKKMILH